MYNRWESAYKKHRLSIRRIKQIQNSLLLLSLFKFQVASKVKLFPYVSKTSFFPKVDASSHIESGRLSGFARKDFFHGQIFWKGKSLTSLSCLVLCWAKTMPMESGTLVNLMVSGCCRYFLSFNASPAFFAFSTSREPIGIHPMPLKKLLYSSLYTFCKRVKLLEERC